MRAQFEQAQDKERRDALQQDAWQAPGQQTDPTESITFNCLPVLACGHARGAMV